MSSASSSFAASEYSSFIDNARSCGLPTNFLTEVAKRYSFDLADPSGPDYTVKWFHEIDLKASTLKSVHGLKFDRGIGGSVGTIYHESTHAWLWMKEDDQPIKDFIKNGKSYYHAVPLGDDDVVSDEDRVFHEAMGEYVGHRASTWFNCMAILLDYSTDIVSEITADMIAKKTILIKKQKQLFNAAMAQRVFGYQSKGGADVWTKMGMSSQMKNFCDQTLLENKFKDQFEQNPRLVEVWNNVAKSYPGIDR